MTVPWEEVRNRMMQNPEVRAEYERLGKCEFEKERRAMRRFGKRRLRVIAAGLIAALVVGLFSLQPFLPPSEIWAPTLGHELPFPGSGPFLPILAALAGASLVFVCLITFSSNPMFIDDPIPPDDP